MLNYVMTAIETAIMMTIMLLPEARWFFAAGLHIRSYYRPSWTDSKISFILLGITRQHDRSEMSNQQNALGKVSKKTEFIWDFVPNYG